MPASDDLLLGKLAVQLKFITRAQLVKCVQVQESESPPQPLGEILKDKGFLNQEQFQRIIEMQSKNLAKMDPKQRKRREDILFGKIVLRQKLTGTDQVNECLRLQGKDGENRGLGEIMIEKGYLTREQVKQILSHQLKKIMSCPTCRLQFTVVSSSGGKNAKCPRCRGELVDHKPGDTISTHGEFQTVMIRKVTVEAEKPEPEAPKIKVTCIICDNVFEGALDPTGRAKCPSCHTSFTPKN